MKGQERRSVKYLPAYLEGEHLAPSTLLRGAGTLPNRVSVEVKYVSALLNEMYKTTSGKLRYTV